MGKENRDTLEHSSASSPSSSISHFTNAPSLALFTDLYEFTMAQAYWQSARNAQATFSLFFRKYPPDRAYFVFVGLADVLDYLENFRFAPGDIAFLRALERFDDELLRYLGQLRLTGRVRAMAEGAIFFINEPVIEVTASVIASKRNWSRRFWSTRSICRRSWQRRPLGLCMRPVVGGSSISPLAGWCARVRRLTVSELAPR
jgi:hypothetical protein